jgi:hypothetical protein
VVLPCLKTFPRASSTVCTPRNGIPELHVARELGTDRTIGEDCSRRRTSLAFSQDQLAGTLGVGRKPFKASYTGS